MRVAAVCLVALATVSALATGSIPTTCVKPKMLALCIDDGPGTHAVAMLDTLKKLGIQATFHVTTLNMLDPNVRALIKRTAADGHLVGLRTEAKWNLMSMSDDQIKSGLVRQANLLATIIGYTPRFVRLPYNGFDDRVVKAVQSTGLVITSHSLDPRDYNNKAEEIVNTFHLAFQLALQGQPHISVQHDSEQQSVAALPAIKKMASSYGYKFVTLDECLNMGDARSNKEQLVGGDDPMDFSGMVGDSDSAPTIAGRIPGMSEQSSGALRAAALPAMAVAVVAAFMFAF